MSRMKPFRDLITYEEAKKIILENTVRMERTEVVPLQQAHGRVLAASVTAGMNIPGFRRAAMDGYAVRAQDTYGAARTSPKHLEMIGSIYTGDKPDGIVQVNQCVQIATGAPMPDGADAVVMVEETSVGRPVSKSESGLERASDRASEITSGGASEITSGEASETGSGGASESWSEINIYKPVYPGANVSAPNADISQGDEVLNKGTLVSPPGIGVLAALGYKEVEVYARPRVSIFPTGEEIVTPGKDLDFGKVYDINSYTLASLLDSNGAAVEINPISGDSMDDLEECFALASASDYAIFSGGSSVGERDLLVNVLEKMGEVLFHGIALKPGKPTLFGRVNDTLVFGMPGYPTSCLTNAYVLLAPSVRKMAGLPSAYRTSEAVLAQRIVSTIGRHHLYPVRLEEGNVYPVFKESGAITSMSHASGWIEIPHNTEFLEEGTKVAVHHFY